MTKQQQIETMQRELRELREELARYRSNYATLADLVSDAAMDIRLGRDIVPSVKAELAAFTWTE